MYIATDAELKRDPHLGDGHYLRFKPTKYSGERHLTQTDPWLPKLPAHIAIFRSRNIKNTSQKIISVVGDEASGKSIISRLSLKS